MIAILLVECHELVRVGIKSVLDAVDGFQVIADTDNGESAVRLAKQHRPDVTLLDTGIPGMGGLETTRRLAALAPFARVIAVAAHDAEAIPEHLIETGAFGYLSKSATLDEIITAIRSVSRGERYIGAEIARKMAYSMLPGSAQTPLQRLSRRELQVMMMVSEGQKTQEISSSLCLSPKTVSTYRYRLYEKLGVDNDVKLTHFALRHGVILRQNS